MTERWWDPAGPAVALLDPGTDQRADTANALIAMHRAGAAALMDAAATPLVDEHTVTEALIGARQAYAEPVRIAVGRSLGDPVYAGVLLAEVADDAELAALGLFRGAVAKGIAPPIAAQRAALVYGVPRASLGKYAVLAIDPAAKDIMVTDTADRALFGWVEHTVDLELSQISKAETPDQRRAAQAQEPRQAGRYAATQDTPTTQIGGVDANAWLAQQLAGAPTEETSHEVATTPAIGSRKQPRRLRSVKKIKRLVPIKAETKPGAQLGGRQLGQRSLGAKGLRTTELQRRQIESNLAAAAEATQVSLPDGDMTHLAGPVRAPRLHSDVTYVMTTGQWQAFHAAASQDASKKYLLRSGPSIFTGESIFSAGALQQFIGHGTETDSVDHQHEVTDQLDTMVKQSPHLMDAAEDVIMPLSVSDQQHLERLLIDDDSPAYDNQVTRLKRDYLTQHLTDEYSSDYDVEINHELANVTLMPDYHDPDQWLLVWRPPNQENPYGARAAATLVEVTINADDLHGHSDPGTRYGQGSVELDPNQLLQANAGGEHNLAANYLYDTRLGVRRVQIRAKVIDPQNVSKAETPAQRRAAVAEEHRAGGRWAVADHSTPEIAGQSVQEWLDQQMTTAQTQATRSGPRQLKRIRQLKRAGTTAPASELGTKKLGGRALSPRQLKARQLASRDLAQRALQINRSAPEPGTIPLHDGDEYTVMNDSEIRHLLGVDDLSPQRHLNGSETRALRERGHEGMTGDDIDAVINAGELAKRPEGIGHGEPIMHLTFPYTDQGRERFLKLFHDKVGHGRPGGALGASEINMQRVVHNNAVMLHVAVHDITNYDEARIHVLRWAEASPDAHHTVTWSGSYRLRSPQAAAAELGTMWDEMAHTGRYADNTKFFENPQVELWDITDTPGGNSPTG